MARFVVPVVLKKRPVASVTVALAVVFVAILVQPLLSMYLINPARIRGCGAVPFEYGTGANLEDAEHQSDLANKRFDAMQVLECLSSQRQIRWLHMRGSSIDNSALGILSQFENLENLNISVTHLDATGLKHICKVEGLKNLDLSNCDNLDDSSLLPLKQLRSLLGLVLSNVPVGDASVPLFVDMPSLRKLNLSGTYVTDAGISELRSKRPDLQVTKH